MYGYVGFKNQSSKTWTVSSPHIQTLLVQPCDINDLCQASIKTYSTDTIVVSNGGNVYNLSGLEINNNLGDADVLTIEVLDDLSSGVSQEYVDNYYNVLYISFDQQITYFALQSESPSEVPFSTWCTTTIPPPQPQQPNGAPSGSPNGSPTDTLAPIYTTVTHHWWIIILVIFVIIIGASGIIYFVKR